MGDEASAPTPERKQRKETPPGGAKLSLTGSLGLYLWEEIQADYGPADPQQQQKQRDIYNFFLVPLELEKVGPMRGATRRQNAPPHVHGVAWRFRAVSSVRHLRVHGLLCVPVHVLPRPCPARPPAIRPRPPPTKVVTPPLWSPPG